MQPLNAPVRKIVLAVTAVAALGGAGFAAPEIVSAASNNGQPSGRSVVDAADDRVRSFGRQHGSQPGDDRAQPRRSGLDSPRDRAERTAPNGRHREPGDDCVDDAVEPGDDHGNHVEPGDDHGSRVELGVSDSSGSSGDSSGHGGGGDDNSGHGGGDD